MNQLNEYERNKLQQLVDILYAGDRPSAWLLEEAADIISRLLSDTDH